MKKDDLVVVKLTAAPQAVDDIDSSPRWLRLVVCDVATGSCGVSTVISSRDL